MNLQIKFQSLNPEWQKTIVEIINHAAQLDFGEIVITVQEKRPLVTEYTVKRKPANSEDFKITLLGD